MDHLATHQHRLLSWATFSSVPGPILVPRSEVDYLKAVPNLSQTWTSKVGTLTTWHRWQSSPHGGVGRRSAGGGG